MFASVEYNVESEESISWYINMKYGTYRDYIVYVVVNEFKLDKLHKATLSLTSSFNDICNDVCLMSVQVQVVICVLYHFQVLECRTRKWRSQLTAVKI